MIYSLRSDYQEPELRRFIGHVAQVGFLRSPVEIVTKLPWPRR